MAANDWLSQRRIEVAADRILDAAEELFTRHDPSSVGMNEIAKAADVGGLVSEDEIPVRAEVRGASELLGIDPMYVACEGRLVAVVPGEAAGQAVAALMGLGIAEAAARRVVESAAARLGDAAEPALIKAALQELGR